MKEMDGFGDIAPYLTQPLVLAGFALFAVLGVHRALLKGGRISPLTARTSGRVVQGLVRYGFVIALLVIVMGFAFALYRTEREHSPAHATSTLKQGATATDGGTAINAGRDLTSGARLSTPVAGNATSPSTEKESAAASVSQDAKAARGGISINAGRDADIHK
jgi:hypothetical protein